MRQPYCKYVSQNIIDVIALLQSVMQGQLVSLIAAWKTGFHLGIGISSLWYWIKSFLITFCNQTVKEMQAVDIFMSVCLSEWKWFFGGIVEIKWIITCQDKEELLLCNIISSLNMCLIWNFNFVICWWNWKSKMVVNFGQVAKQFRGTSNSGLKLFSFFLFFFSNKKLLSTAVIFQLSLCLFIPHYS